MPINVIGRLQRRRLYFFFRLLACYDFFRVVPLFASDDVIDCFDLQITIDQLHVDFDVLQSVVTKWGSNLNRRQLVLQSRAGMAKWDNFY